MNTAIRIPDDLARKIRQSAINNMRSLNSEMVLALHLYVGHHVQGKRRPSESERKKAIRKLLPTLPKKSGRPFPMKSNETNRESAPLHIETTWDQWPVLRDQFVAEHHRAPLAEELMPYRDKVNKALGR